MVYLGGIRTHDLRIKVRCLPGLATEANIYSYLDVDSSHTRQL